MKAVRIHEFGGLEVLKWEDVPEPSPRTNQVLIKVDSAGVNYADIIRRLNRLEVNIETVGHAQVVAGLEVARDLIGVDIRGEFIGERQHDDVGAARRVADGRHFEPCGFDLGPAG